MRTNIKNSHQRMEKILNIKDRQLETLARKCARSIKVSSSTHEEIKTGNSSSPKCKDRPSHQSKSSVHDGTDDGINKKGSPNNKESEDSQPGPITDRASLCKKLKFLSKACDSNKKKPIGASLACFGYNATIIAFCNYEKSKLGNAFAAAYKMFETIERKPKIDAYDTDGVVLEDIKGDIELKDVHFRYPARPDVQIFAGFSLRVPNATTTAMVISLWERFYDPDRGEVLIDGVNLKNF
ncbi:hypothetical protein PIB30_038665 [Stylosanthes scabra]|uniref:Uncharacterized protein n=1 Tax=Stylosanthes scabra TaxID=79078 RepID=A0ABU6YEG7_9FABA|nr:hypothetical protein [Stylosanthes scabra]